MAYNPRANPDLAQPAKMPFTSQQTQHTIQGIHPPTSGCTGFYLRRLPGNNIVVKSCLAYRYPSWGRGSPGMPGRQDASRARCI